jgi:hypothetical protein
LGPEANPRIVSYNVSAVKINLAANSQVRFENKNTTLKNALAYFGAGVVAVN